MSRTRAMISMSLAVALAACGDATESPSMLSIGSVPDAASPHGSALSPAARHVSQIAFRNGDRDFLMLDKKNGRIIVFQNGRPTFSGAALTGENPSDRLAPDAMSKSFAEQKGMAYKVTPAGRFTLSTGYDHNYGETLDINEIQGSDWDIAIHKVWLGAPGEHRDLRLRTPGGADKHITYGCVDVDGSTMQQLIARIPDEERTPIYILPSDDSLIGTLFKPREATAGAFGPAG